MPQAAVFIIFSVIVLSLTVQAYALYDLLIMNTHVDRESVKTWAFIIIFGSIFGALTYFLVAKSNE